MARKDVLLNLVRSFTSFASRVAPMATGIIAVGAPVAKYPHRPMAMGAIELIAFAVAAFTD